jgi:hypothetical protein
MDAMIVEGSVIGARPVDSRLQRIAAVTGVPIETFFGASAPRPFSEFGELVTLWASVADEAGRSQILDCARAVARRSGNGAAGPS